MTDDSEFITKLISFGLSEKEAQLYLHLLKHGPKSTSLLTKSLKRHREDVHRTLISLVDKGVVSTSHESPTAYAAVDLDLVLDTALKKHETELREMEWRKHEIEELSKQHRFRPSDEFSTFKILKRAGDVVTTKLSILNSTEKEWFAVVPAILTVFSSLYFVEDDKKFIDRGGTIRFITDITHPYIEVVQQHLDMGMEVRHFDKYTGIIFCVFDKKISITAINTDLKHVSLNEPITALWTDDLTYAQYLVSTFELLWELAVPAAQRIEELLKAGPPQI